MFSSDYPHDHITSFIFFALFFSFLVFFDFLCHGFSELVRSPRCLYRCNCVGSFFFFPLPSCVFFLLKSSFLRNSVVLFFLGFQRVLEVQQVRLYQSRTCACKGQTPPKKSEKDLNKNKLNEELILQQTPPVNPHMMSSAAELGINIIIPPSFRQRNQCIRDSNNCY